MSDLKKQNFTVVLSNREELKIWHKSYGEFLFDVEKSNGFISLNVIVNLKTNKTVLRLVNIDHIIYIH